MRRYTNLFSVWVQQVHAEGASDLKLLSLVSCAVRSFRNEIRKIRIMKTPFDLSRAFSFSEDGHFYNEHPYLASTVLLELLQGCSMALCQISYMDIIPNACQRTICQCSAHPADAHVFPHFWMCILLGKYVHNTYNREQILHIRPGMALIVSLSQAIQESCSTRTAYLFLEARRGSLISLSSQQRKLVFETQEVIICSSILIQPMYTFIAPLTSSLAVK